MTLDTSKLKDKNMDGIFNKSNRDRREYWKEHYQKNKEKYYIKAKRWQQVNKIKVRENVRNLMKKLRMMVFEKFGKKCCRCGFDDIRALQIDHVNGGGVKEYRLLRGGRNFYKKVLNDTNGSYQILCANCNWIKRSENNENVKRLNP